MRCGTERKRNVKLETRFETHLTHLMISNTYERIKMVQDYSDCVAQSNAWACFVSTTNGERSVNLETLISPA